MDSDLQKNSPQKVWWVLAYLVSPSLAFLCLRLSKVIGTIECILGVSTGLVVHVGLASVLAKTNGEPLQIFITLLMSCSFYLILMWQYLAGERKKFWTENAKQQWRMAGVVFGFLLGLGIVTSITYFHLL